MSLYKLGSSLSWAIPHRKDIQHFHSELSLYAGNATSKRFFASLRIGGVRTVGSVRLQRARAAKKWWVIDKSSQEKRAGRGPYWVGFLARKSCHGNIANPNMICCPAEKALFFQWKISNARKRRWSVLVQTIMLWKTTRKIRAIQW